MKTETTLLSLPLWVLITIYCLLPTAVSAQENATEGTEFYLVFGRNQYTNNSDEIRYVITEACTVTAQYFDGTYLDDNVGYAPGIYTKVVDKAKCEIGTTSPASDSRIWTNMGLKVTSNKNIGLYAINVQSVSTDATTVLPLPVLGDHYTVIGNRGMSTQTTRILVIGLTNGTTITIRDPSGTAVLSNQVLQAQEVYCYALAVTDLTGYTVESNHIVAVFSTGDCGDVSSTGGCDHNFEQMWPTNTAGKNFFIWNLSNRTGGVAADKIVILALENGTQVVKKEGTTSTTHTLNKHQTTNFFLSTTNVYANNSSAPVKIIADKPVILNNILGYAPTIKWLAPVEQRINSAVISPFVPAAFSMSNGHELSILIPAGSESNMVVKETRSGATTIVPVTFYTNLTDPDWMIGRLEYIATDNVLVELSNPAGLLANMQGAGNSISYIMTAGAGAFNLQAYYTITTKTTPFNDVYYTETEEATHTFETTDNITLKRTIEKPFTQVQWLVDGAPYSVSENTNTSNTVTVPASAFGGACGSHSISMSVRYSGATADSVYTGIVWLNDPPEVTVAVSSPIVCSGSPLTFTANVSSGSTPAMTYTWDIGGTAATTTSNTYTTTLSTTSTYSVSVKNSNGCTSSYTAPQTITISSTCLWEIWNWDDLSQVPAMQTAGFTAFKVMQNIGVPDDATTYGDGTGSGRTDLTRYGWYGYEGFGAGIPGFNINGTLAAAEVLYAGLPTGVKQHAFGWDTTNNSGWIPINISDGNFNGNNHIISGLWIDRENSILQGLFGQITNNRTVHDLGVVVAPKGVKGFYNVGGFVGTINAGTITNCYVTGEGEINGTGTTGSERSIGGFVGSYAGATRITNCYATVDVNGGYAVGGFVGTDAGSAVAVVSRCYATGNVNGMTYVGGFIGSKAATSNSTIENCYTTGAVIGSSVSLAGFCAEIYNGAIRYCYASGETNGSGFVRNVYGGATITNCYYDTWSTGSGATSTGVTPLTTAQMVSGLPTGFNATIWAIQPDESYPYLRYQERTSEKFDYHLKDITVNGNLPSTISSPPMTAYSVYSPLSGASAVFRAAVANSNPADCGYLPDGGNVLLPAGATHTVSNGKHIVVQGMSVDHIVKPNVVRLCTAASPSLSGSTNVCVGSTHTYTASGSNITDYAWSVTGGVILSGAGTNSVNVEWNVLGTANINLTITDINDCLSNPSSLNITVIPTVIPSLSISAVPD